VTQPPALQDFKHRYVRADEPEGAPTLLLLHGTGGNETDLLPLGRELSPRAALLSPRGRVLEGAMPRFFKRLAEGVFDLEDLTLRTHELGAWLTVALAHYELDPKRVIAVGYSNGANIAAAMLVLGAARFAGAVLLRPMVPLEPESPPDLSGLAVLIASGRYDPAVSVDHPERLKSLLEGCGASVTLTWQEGGHALEPAEIAQAGVWLKQHGWS
jgi:predicted esterase